MKKSLKYNKKTRKNIGGQLTDHQELYCQQLNCYNETKKNGFGSCKRHPSTVFKSSEGYKPEICSDRDSVHNIVLGGLPKPKPEVKIDLSSKPNYDFNELEIGRRYIFTVDKRQYKGKVTNLFIRENPQNSGVVLEDVTKNGEPQEGKHTLTSGIIEKITGENYTIDDIANMHPDITRNIRDFLGGRKSKKVIKRKKKKSLKKNKKKRKTKRNLKR